MKISYIDFWPNFEPENFWITRFLKNYYKNIEISKNPNESDVIFGSCFGCSISLVKNNKAKKILFLGENVRPNYEFYDFSLSFDFNDYEKKNFRLPLWMLYIDWWDKNSDDISLDELHNKFDSKEVHNREKFACIVISNPVKNRIELFNKLNSYKKVDGFGSVFGSKFLGSKKELLKKYRFNICFENSIYPGYCTEKLLQSKVSGCIPLYYGCKEANLDFNEKCYLNLLDFKNIDDFVKKIIEIENNKDLFFEIASEPLFNKKPSLDFFYDFIKRIT